MWPSRRAARCMRSGCRELIDQLSGLWSNIYVVKEIAISEFKAKCLAILDEVQKTKQPIRVTRRGRPIAEVSPPAPTKNGDWIGSMKDSKILSDIISPASEESDWEVLRD